MICFYASGSDEQKFLEASMAYMSVNPIMNDEENDKLKMKLKVERSEIVVEGARCSLRTRKATSSPKFHHFHEYCLAQKIAYAN